MTGNILEKLFEHNNWANLQIIRACATLSDEQLDMEPQSAMMGNIRRTLLHLVRSQRGYLRQLTLPLEERLDTPTLDFADVEEVARLSGEGFVALARDVSKIRPETYIQQHDGYRVEPWVVMVQAINHATEHREQIKSMLTSLGIEPPSIDGWDYGELTGALIPPAD
jgi:uncharacterized damage-inducible protein DinB